MMWAIFCALAFCNFQMVFADTEELQDDILDASFKGVKPLTDVYTKTDIDFSAAAKAVKIKGMSRDEILQRCVSTKYNSRFAKSYQTKLNKCDGCYDKAENTKDIQAADECCKKETAQFKIDAKVYMVHAKACFAKCAQDGSKCREELTNIQKRESKEYQNAFKDDAQNV